MPDSVSRSWFCVLNNPSDHGYNGTPEEICEKLRAAWIDHPDRTGAWAYCISKDGFHHVHMVLEGKAMRFSAVKQVFGTAHIEATRGNKSEAEDYITKQGKYAESGEQVVCVVRHGEIQGKGQGHRSDLEKLADLIQAGLTPREIMRSNFSFRRYDSLIRKAYFDKRWEETPPMREVLVHYIVGPSGSGKTHLFKELVESKGEGSVYLLNEYTSGWDRYEAEPIVFMDEYKSQIPFATFLSILDKYKVQIHARYSNVWALWNEVYITSVIPPEELYSSYNFDRRDTISQLLRRIDDITFCFRDSSGYHKFTIPMAEYTSYEELQNRAYETLGDPKEPQNVENEGQAPAQSSPSKKKDQLMIGDSPEDFEEISPEDDLPF